MSSSNKKRMCPAVSREISSGECGGNRHSRYACPESCQYNPFSAANYDQSLAIEDGLQPKVMEWLDVCMRGPGGFRDQFEKIRHSPSGTHALVTWSLFMDRDHEGMSRADRWQKGGFTGLKNDEQVLLQCQMRTRMVLWEVHRVLPGDRFEAVDLLDPLREKMLVLDRRFSAAVGRFSTWLGWYYPMPHFGRSSGSVISLFEISNLEPEEVVAELVKHLGGPLTVPEMRLWLAKNFVRFESALTAVGIERRRRTIASIDANFGKAVYKLNRKPSTIKTRLKKVPEVAVDGLGDVESSEGFREAMVWFEEGQGVDLKARGGSALGRVLIGQTHCRLEAVGKDRLGRLRSLFEGAMGSAVTFEGQRLDDFGRQMALKSEPADLSLVPPRLLDNPVEIALGTSRLSIAGNVEAQKDPERWLLEEQDTAFLKNRIPFLGNLTPEEAAKDPAQRKALIRLLKNRIANTDKRCLEQGIEYDINWMLKKLGVTEIIVDPPPRRSRPASHDVVDPSLLPWPPLPPQEPYSVEEADLLMGEVIDRFATPMDADEAIVRGGGTILDDIEELTLELLEDREFTLLLTVVKQVWLVMVPPGCQAPHLDIEELKREFLGNIERVEQFALDGNAKLFQKFIAESRQPGIVAVGSAQVSVVGEELIESGSIRPECLSVLIAMIRAVVDVTDRALREQFGEG